MTDVDARQLLDLYFPLTDSETMNKLVGFVLKLSPLEQDALRAHIRPWDGAGGRGVPTRSEDEDPSGRLWELFPKLNSLRYGESGVSAEQFQESLARTYDSLDGERLRAWRSEFERLDAAQKSILHEYFLAVELLKTTRIGAGKRFAEYVRTHGGDFRNFRDTIERLNAALGDAASMPVKFDTYDSSDWVLRYLAYGETPPARSESDGRQSTRTEFKK